MNQRDRLEEYLGLIETGPASTAERLLAGEVKRLRRGLQQIIESDYPASAVDAETWAQEVLDNPDAVEWERLGWA